MAKPYGPCWNSEVAGRRSEAYDDRSIDAGVIGEPLSMVFLGSAPLNLVYVILGRDMSIIHVVSRHYSLAVNHT